MDPKTRSVPSYWTLWGTYMEGCNCTNNCGMDSTHSTWCKQISHAWRRFAAVLPLGFLHSVGCSHAQIILASSVCISLQGEAIFVHRRTTFAVPPLLRHQWLGQNASLITVAGIAQGAAIQCLMSSLSIVTRLHSNIIFRDQGTSSSSVSSVSSYHLRFNIAANWPKCFSLSS